LEATARGESIPKIDYIVQNSNMLRNGLAATQFSHEIGHTIVTRMKQLNVTGPILIPSPITGLTATVNRIKDPFPTRQDLLQFAVSGPLLGMLTSVLLMYVGLQLTPNTKEAIPLLPLLPISLLKQSTLASGLVDSVLGSGFVEGLQSTGTNDVPLSALAIAGFLGMMINALAMAPYGRTDGGRAATALLGRSGAQGISLLTSIAFFIISFTYNDNTSLSVIFPFLLFMGFYQGEQEVPCRNEVDEPGAISALLAGFAWFLMVLILTPA